MDVWGGVVVSLDSVHSWWVAVGSFYLVGGHNWSGHRFDECAGNTGGGDEN